MSVTTEPVSPGTPDVPAPGAPALAARLRTLLATRPVYVLVGVLIALYAVTCLVEPSTLSVTQVRNLILLACPYAILGASQTVCMLTGGIDLSVVMTANLAAYVAANQFGKGAGSVQALLLALLCGVVVGLLNGIGIGAFKVNPLIMTIGMSSILLGFVTAGLKTFLSGSTRMPPIVIDVSRGTLIGPLPTNIIVLALVAALMLYMLNRTGFGRSVYAVGDNPLACRLAGIKVWRVLLAVYMLAAVLAAVAGLVIAGATGATSPSMANAYLLPSVAAVVIGGTSILGGAGGYSGTIVGALILSVLNKLLLAIDTSEAVRQILYGVIVLALAWVYVRLTNRGT